jgi:hypothetical protein
VPIGVRIPILMDVREGADGGEEDERGDLETGTEPSTKRATHGGHSLRSAS